MTAPEFIAIAQFGAFFCEACMSGQHGRCEGWAGRKESPCRCEIHQHDLEEALEDGYQRGIDLARKAKQAGATKRGPR